MNSPDARQNGGRYVRHSKAPNAGFSAVHLLRKQLLIYRVGGIIVPIVRINVLDILLKGIIA
jgi:high-affinity K+ transport system ATPase subunit B